MKFLVIICVLLISTAAPTAAQRVSSTTLTRVQIREVERRLAALGYWPGAVDGRFDSAAQSALIAFQKWEGRAVTGRPTLDELEAIRNAVAPKAREVGYEHVEIDVDRQVMLLVNQEGKVNILPVSTGSGKPYLDQGQTSIAYTPRGRFIVYDKVRGWETGEFSSMYYSNYISGGVAIHGYRSVPTTPASHGCIRIPLFAARQVSKQMPIGTIVLVYDKVSFVSAKEWVTNPRLKEEALASAAFVYDGETDVKSPRQSP